MNTSAVDIRKKILVLGANGFIGKNIAQYILSNKYIDDYIFYFVARNDPENAVNDIRYLKYDLLDNESLEKIFDITTPDYIINLAGTLDSSNIGNCIAVNAELPRKILDIVLERKLSTKILFIGSAAEYGLNTNIPLTETDELKPLTAYGLSKTIQAAYVKFYAEKFNISVNIARTFNIIGQLMSDRLSIGSFIRQINNSKNGDTIATGNLSSERDYLYIDDVIDAFFRILFEGKTGQIYNVCSGKPISMATILNALIKASGKNINTQIKPELIRRDDIPVSYGNNERLMHDLGWVQAYQLENIYHKLI